MAADRKEYMKAYNARWRAENPERARRLVSDWQRRNRAKRAAYMRSWNARNRAENLETVRATVRRAKLKRKYGISPERYEALLEAQGGHCALCLRTPEKERYGWLSVDHCHETGKVRGLLCTVHNSAVAAFGDNEFGLRRALEYVTGK